MPSRDLAALTPLAQCKAKKFLQLAKDVRLQVLIYCTYRSPREQACLYRQGRSIYQIKSKANELETVWDRPDLAECLMAVGPQMGKKIRTYAGPGQSIHNYRQAFDGVPMEEGRPVWGTEDEHEQEVWGLYGECVRAAGFEWGGHWETLKDYAHAQLIADWQELIGSEEWATL